ncbi:HDOD domain protein [Pseudoalteromonas sp. P1-9]|uniref:EAL and HDOD domain-containing protein n=1 Tax=Pseudoalteromonas sp. P1-9 TaxID=1710354 RepID=UPI0006D5EC8B|nr:HDOD domain-containing protein [Pseudoalteromonas sp. P1-9]KPV96413.1 HDOD domain protein [Pseudoalteromonas sp. P1-9]
MKIYTARQAVLNHKKRLVAYELLFRNSRANSFPTIDPVIATSKLIADSQFIIGLRRLTSGKKALIKFPHLGILQKQPELLPSNDFIVELMTDFAPNQEVYEACRSLFHKNYVLALDSYTPDFDWQPYCNLCRLAKFDISRTPLNTVIADINKLKQQKNLKLMATKIETHEDFELAKQLGFDYFQGYFLCRPQLIEQQDMVSHSQTVVLLYTELVKEELNYDKIANLVEQDAALCYKLLRFINSGLFPTREEINSIKQGLIYLGDQNAKRFLNLVVTAHFAKDKPHELIRMSTIRAKFCDVIAQKIAPSLKSKSFLVGLFSLLDAIFDRSMDVIIKQLPLGKDISDALIGQENLNRNILELVLSYESGNWQKIESQCNKLKLDQADLPAFYYEAIKWSDILYNCTQQEDPL